MTRPLNTYDHISIAEIVIYSFLLIGGIVLIIKHGFRMSASWRYLVVLSLARLIGSSMLLATIKYPTNTDLYIGWVVTNGIGLGPLILVLIGIISRLFDSINHHRVVFKPLWGSMVQGLIVVAVVLIIVGGTEAKYDMDGSLSPKVHYTTLSRVGMALMIVVYVLLILQTLIVFKNQGYVAQGEHRLLLAVVASLPFVGVRLVYGCLTILGGIRASAWTYLVMLIIMETIAATICTVIGLCTTRPVLIPNNAEQGNKMQPPPQGDHQYGRVAV